MNSYGTVYLGTDNHVAVRLTDRGQAVPGGIENTTRAVATLEAETGGQTVIDSDVNASAFDWNTEGADSILRMQFGGVALAPGRHRVRLDTWDSSKRYAWSSLTASPAFVLDVVAAP